MNQEIHEYTIPIMLSLDSNEHFIFLTNSFFKCDSNKRFAWFESIFDWENWVLVLSLWLNHNLAWLESKLIWFES